MASKYTQDNRMMQLTTPLGKDFLLIDKMSVKEAISELFSIEVQVLHEEKDGWKAPEPIDYKKILGQPVSINILQADDEVGRSFSGLVSEFTYGWRSERFSHYWMKIVPDIWIFTQTKQSRIFQQKTVKSIITDVFQGYENYIVWEIDDDYKPRNYCVQYRESDFDFASRLMEEEGIYYYFEHKDESHKMVISDRKQFNRDCPGKPELKFVDIETQHYTALMVRTWETDLRIGPGQFVYRDHNLQQPLKKLETAGTSNFIVGDNSSWEVYDYPGGYARKFDGIDPSGNERGDLDNIVPDGKRTVKTTTEIADARFQTASVKTDCSALTAGHLFKLADHPIKELNGQYVITSISHSASQSPAYDRNDEEYADEGEAYSNEFNALAHGRTGSVQFRPEQTTDKPVVYGAQTAVVVGGSGEEIYTDPYGRIKIQFYWDREGQTDGLDSCWAPVAQSWAGNGWGSMFIPRVGMEVIVHFLEGDPDQPIVTGCVYNPMNMPPYALPDEKTKSTIKTYSTKGGEGFNEFRFEDKKGSEQVFIHGEKDLDVYIKNDRREFTKNDQHLIVKNDLFEKIEGDTHLKIGGNQFAAIQGDRHLKVTGKEAVEISGGKSLKVTGNVNTSITGNHSEETTGTIYLKGMNVVIEGMTQVSLKVGGNFVDISPAGVAITGTMVLINSGGAPGAGMGPSVVPPTAPQDPAEADNAEPGKKVQLEKQSFERKRKKPSKEDPKSWIEVKLVDEENNPVPGQGYEVVEGDGTVHSGSLDENGKAHVKLKNPGSCQVSFPDLDQGAWEEA
jgi:type VI secretion system secreted protein VgrG